MLTDDERKTINHAADVLGPSLRDLATRLRAIAAPRVATVGELLATAPVFEWFAGPDWWQARFTTAGVELRWRHPRALIWAPWARRGSMKPRMGFAARTVPASEADRDPSTRGPIGEG